MMDFRSEIVAFVRSSIHPEAELQGPLLVVPDQSQLIRLQALKDSKHNSQQPVIWEDQWRCKQAIVKSKLLSLSGKSTRIHGRETTVQKLSKPESEEFLNQNHLMGSTNAKLKFGLTLNRKIVSLATFSKPTTIDRSGIPYKSYELIRFCNLSGHTVVGGLSKLLKHFIDLVNPDDIMTYVDREWSDGKSYRNLGFKMVETTPPQTFWVNTQTFQRQYKDPESDLVNFIKCLNAGNYKFILFKK